MKKERFSRINLDKMAAPPTEDGLYRVVTQSYWLIDENGYGLIYYGHSLQCNKNENIGNGLIKSGMHPAVGKKYYECIYIPCDYDGNYCVD